MNKVIFQEKDGSTLGNLNTAGDYTMIENLRTGQTAAFVVNVKEAGEYLVSFKGCTKRDNVSTKWEYMVDGEAEAAQTVSIQNNGSWGNSVGAKWDDYSFTIKLTKGVKKLLITFSAEKYTANIAQIKMTLASEDGIRELSADTPADASVIYDLSGRRVARMNKGIYIQGEKKVVR